jgi:hypothetical protein
MKEGRIVKEGRTVKEGRVLKEGRNDGGEVWDETIFGT